MGFDSFTCISSGAPVLVLRGRVDSETREQGCLWVQIKMVVSEVGVLSSLRFLVVSIYVVDGLKT